MRTCTTHHHACDCREAHFKQLEKEFKTMFELRAESLRKLSVAQKALENAEEWAHSDFCSDECHPFHLEISKALAEIENK